MSRGLFITGTGTDVGKTYVTALIVKKLKEGGCNAGYYKAALSGADSAAESDAGYVKRTAGIPQREDTLISYLYQNAVSPHLAAKLEKHPVDIKKIKADYRRVQEACDYVTVEGSGGIVCPVRWDEKCRLLLEDIIKELDLSTLIVADAGLGSINAAVLTTAYLRGCGIGIRGIILNRYTGGIMQEDNRRMIEALTGIPVLAVVHPDEADLQMEAEILASLYA